MKHELFAVDELQPGELRSVDVDGLAVVVARTPSGDFRALRDICPHYGAKLSGGVLQPLYDGPATGLYEEVEHTFVLRCPWHGYEFSMDDGRCIADPASYRVKSYELTTENGLVYLTR